MRTKRQQKHRRMQDAALSLSVVVSELPESFESLWDVDYEEALTYECPCCIERREQHASTALWAFLESCLEPHLEEYERQLEARYAHLWPRCGLYCFCSHCCERRDHGVFDHGVFDHDYGDWKRAFPDLPWESESCLWCGSPNYNMIDIGDGLERTSCCQVH